MSQTDNIGRPPGDGHVGGNLFTSDEYERQDDGTLQKKEGTTVSCERYLTTHVCIYLYNNGIDFDVEHDVGDRNDCDIIVPSVNLAVECKKNDFSKKVDRAIEQCNTYMEHGYDTVLVCPRRMSKPGQKTIDVMDEHSIPYMEFDLDKREFTTVQLQGEISPLVML